MILGRTIPRWAVLTLMGVAILAIVTQLVVGFAFLNWGGTDWGADLRGYLDATRSWMHGDGFYLPRQLHGPYEIELGDVLYPPTALYVFVPFLVLPPLLWWVLGVGLLAYLVWSWRPRLLAVALMLACLAFPNMAIVFFRGAPVIVVDGPGGGRAAVEVAGRAHPAQAIDPAVRAHRDQNHGAGG